MQYLKHFYCFILLVICSCDFTDGSVLDNVKNNKLKVPTNITTTAISDNQINIAWQDNSNNETGFKIERSTSPDFISITDFKTEEDTQQFIDTSLNENTTYYYRITAYNNYGQSDYSNTNSTNTKSFLEEQLVAHYKFENTCMDEVTGNYSTTNVNSDGYVLGPGDKGKAINFQYNPGTGKGQYVNLGSEKKLDFPEDGFQTICFWAKTGDENSSGLPQIVSHGPTDTHGFQILLYNANIDIAIWKTIVTPDNENYYRQFFTSEVVKGSWHFFAFIFDRKNHKLFVYKRDFNNISLDAVNSNGINLIGDYDIASKALFLGGEGTGRSWDGAMDDFRLYNIALTENQLLYVSNLINQ